MRSQFFDQQADYQLDVLGGCYQEFTPPREYQDATGRRAKLVTPATQLGVKQARTRAGRPRPPGPDLSRNGRISFGRRLMEAEIAKTPAFWDTFMLWPDRKQVVFQKMPRNCSIICKSGRG